MSGAPDHSPTAIIVAGDDQTRMLLRALVQLHHIWVEGEAAGETYALELVRAYSPSLLVVDSGLAEGSSDDLVCRARALVPKIRVVLVTPGSHPHSLPMKPAEQPDSTLLRPFRFPEFVRALGPLCD